MKIAIFVVWLALGLMIRSEGAVVMAPAPEGETLSSDYQVDIAGQAVPVYKARVLDAPFNKGEYDYGGDYSFANFDLDGPAEVRIRSSKPLSKLVVTPANSSLKVQKVDENVVLLKLAGPCKFSFEPDGKRAPLLLFASAVEPAPQKDRNNLVYFPPGVHRPEKIMLTNGQSLYLAAGSIVKGGVIAHGNNIRIYGRGILDGSDWGWIKGPTPHTISIRGTNVEVSGITVRGSPCWTIVPQNSANVVVRDVKICGSRVQNDDGINPCNSTNVRISDCFIRTDDDCVAMKGLDLDGANVERVSVENCILWCDRARIFLLGHESRAAFMRNIKLTNLDIVHFSMTAFLFEPGEEMQLENVLVEDVRIHSEGQREFIRLKPVVNQYMHNKVPGHIARIRFRNIVMEGAVGPALVQIEGADEAHQVRNVSLEKLSFGESKLNSGSDRLKIGAHVSNIQVLP